MSKAENELVQSASRLNQEFTPAEYAILQKVFPFAGTKPNNFPAFYLDSDPHEFKLTDEPTVKDPGIGPVLFKGPYFDGNGITKFNHAGNDYAFFSFTHQCSQNAFSLEDAGKLFQIVHENYQKDQLENLIDNFTKLNSDEIFPTYFVYNAFIDRHAKYFPDQLNAARNSLTDIINDIESAGFSLGQLDFNFKTIFKLKKYPFSDAIDNLITDNSSTLFDFMIKDATASSWLKFRALEVFQNNRGRELLENKASKREVFQLGSNIEEALHNEKIVFNKIALECLETVNQSQQPLKIKPEDFQNSYLQHKIASGGQVSATLIECWNNS